MVTTDERLSRLEGAYEQVDECLGNISRSFEAMRTDMNQCIDALRAEMNQSIEVLRNDINSRLSEMNSRINGLFVVTIGLWITTVAAIIGIYFRG